MLKAISTLLAALAAAAASAGAAGAEDFYAGKTITISTFTAPGGAYDAYVRLLSRHLARYIPGHPGIIAMNQPGAGGILAVNYAGKVAPQDGTFLTLVGVGLVMQEAIGTAGMQVPLRNFKWIGNLSRDNNVVATSPASPTPTIDDARRREVLLGSLGAGSIDAQLPAAYNALLGTRFKTIYGYSGTPQVMLAMERGEVEGKENTWASFKASLGESRARQLHVLVQNATHPDPELPDVPLLIDLVRGDAQKEPVARLLSVALEISKPLAAPPGVPDERVQLLRTAFDATVKDRDFLAEAQKIGYPVDAVAGTQVAAAIGQTLTAPADVIARAKAALESPSR